MVIFERVIGLNTVREGENIMEIPKHLNSAIQDHVTPCRNVFLQLYGSSKVRLSRRLPDNYAEARD